MNVEFLKQLGIEDVNPKIVLNKLGNKEIELLDKRDLAETNGATERLQEIDELIEKIHAEKAIVSEEAKTYVAPVEKKDTKQDAKAERAKKSEIYEKLMKKKQEEAVNLQKSVMDNVTNSTSGANTSQPVSNTASNNGQVASSSTSTTLQNKGSISSAPANSQKQNTVVKNSNNSSNGASSSTTSANVAPVSGNSEYSTGLRYYSKQDYANAFKCFMNVAENKNPADATAMQERTQACYLLAVLYRNGQGTNVDQDRSNHYLRRAADFGNDQAQLEYGELLLSQHVTSSAKDLKARSEGLSYIEKAANSGLVDALKKYVNHAMNSSDADKHVIEKAKKFIPILRTQVDSYEAQKCDDWLNEIIRTEKNAKKKASYPKKFIIGEIIFLLGTIYLFKGLNPKFFSEIIPKVGRFIIEIPDWMIIKWSSLTAFTDPCVTHQGLFGCWLIILGNAVRGLGSQRVKTYSGSKCESFEKAINGIIIVLCVLHFIANVIEGVGFFNGGLTQFILMIGSILIGRVVGWILFKIIK